MKLVRKYIAVSVLLFCFNYNSFAQTLTVDETIKYLGEQMKNFRLIKYGWGKCTFKSFTVNISDNGFVKMKILEETNNRQFENRVGKVAFYDYLFDFRSVRPIIKDNELLL